jgi:hypothetical protein
MAVVHPTGRHLYDLEARDLSLIGRGLRKRFQPDLWRGATHAQRGDMAQAAHAYIRKGYGLDKRPLQLANDWPGFLLGDFDPRTKEVTVNAGLLRSDDPTLLLDALAHENRHAVQQERMEGRQPVPYREDVGYTEVDAWRAASSSYTQSEYVDYHYNALEVDAREAATSLVDEGFWVEHRRLIEERLAEVGR